LSEGAGLPVMEAAAAGRLVIGTPVGHFPRRAYDGGGIIAPIEPEKFKAFTAAALKYYKDNPRHYSEKCASIQKSAEMFDWKYCVSEWIDLIDRARACADHDGDDKRKRESMEANKIHDSNVSAEMESVFSKIYQTKGFGFSESASGPGSSLEKTKKLRNELPGYLKSFGIKTIVDAPCGDFNWMSRLNYEFDLYIGIDIVPDIIQNLRRQFSSKKVRFEVVDICRSLVPEADAIFCRDCFTHMPFSKIQDAVRLFKQSGTRYLLTTTFPDEQNRDVAVGGWRPLNLQAEPFFWPVPVGLLREDFPDNADPWDLNKCIGIWVLSSLP
jgi:SAM-dependent methyltransferase